MSRELDVTSSRVCAKCFCSVVESFASAQARTRLVGWIGVDRLLGNLRRVRECVECTGMDRGSRSDDDARLVDMEERWQRQAMTKTKVRSNEFCS